MDIKYEEVKGGGHVSLTQCDKEYYHICMENRFFKRTYATKDLNNALEYFSACAKELEEWNKC